MLKISLKLAWKTMRENERIYVPFLLGCAAITALIYSIMDLQAFYVSNNLYGGNEMGTLLGFGGMVLCLFALFFFFYINGFLMKSRTAEYGLFTVLGLEKRHLLLILFWQLLICLAISLVFGLLCGFLFSKLMLLASQRILGLDVVLGFSVDWPGATMTALFISILFIAIYLYSAWMITRSDPLELLRSSKQAEKEPRSRWILTLAGLITLGAGYWLAVTTEDPIEAMALFFAAVILVIIGTYLLFISGSVTLLNALQKNKRFYYKTSHFINVSTMKYRMKANAASLASICILSTMILVTISTTFGLYSNLGTTVEQQFPKDINIALHLSEDHNAAAVNEQAALLKQSIAKWDPQNENETLNKIVSGSLKGGQFKDENNQLVEFLPLPLLQTASEQARDLSLAPSQIMVYGKQAESIGANTLNLFGKDYEIVDSSVQYPAWLGPETQAESSMATLIVTASEEDMESIPASWTLLETFDSPSLASMDPAQAEQTVLDALQAEHPSFTQGGASLIVSSQQNAYREYSALYGGLFMVGIFVSAAILVILVLILYYKQVSEGYEDQKRFAILQNIGLEKKQIRKLINEQTLILFFLPLGVAALHLAFGFSMIVRFLSLLVLTEPGVLILMAAICLAIFALVYLVIYRLTSRVYYNIVASA